MSLLDEEPTHWGEIDGVTIEFPMVVESMNAATLTWTVPIGPARALVPGDAFEVLDVGDGRAMLVMALVDYVANPWGDYDEVNLGLMATPVGEPDRAGAFVWRMPVDQHFTRRAGNEVLGLPKTVEDLSIEYPDGPDGSPSMQCRLRLDGHDELVVSLPRPASTGPAESTETDTWSYLDGTPMQLGLAIELGTGVVDPADVEMTLGSGPIADELRSLGLPRAPDLAVWGEGLRGVFAHPRPL